MSLPPVSSLVKQAFDTCVTKNPYKLNSYYNTKRNVFLIVISYAFFGLHFDLWSTAQGLQSDLKPKLPS